MTDINDSKIIDQLLNDLQSKDKAIRTKAAGKLGNIDPTNPELASKVVAALKAMLKNEGYKLARDFAQNSIKKITQPEKTKAEANQRSIAQQNYANPPKDNSLYSAIRTLGSLYGLLGYVVLVLSLFVGLFAGGSTLDESPALGISLFFGSITFGIVIALPMLAAQEFFSLLINQAKDVREIKSAVVDSQSEE